MEGTVGVLRGVKGRTVDILYDLFFTDKLVAAVILIHPSDFNDIYGKIDLSAILFGNFSKQREAKLRSLSLVESRRATFEKKSVRELLALHPNSFEIDYENINAVKVRNKFLTKSLEFEVCNPPGKKVRFFLEENQIPLAQELLKRILPDKLT